MAVIRVTSYVDFKLLVDPGQGHPVYYWLDKGQPYWYHYAPVGSDWLVCFRDGTELPDSLTTFLTDFPKAIELQGGLEFK